MSAADTHQREQQKSPHLIFIIMAGIEVSNYFPNTFLMLFGALWMEVNGTPSSDVFY